MTRGTQGFPRGSESEEATCSVGNLGSIPGLGRYPGGGLVIPLQYSCLESPRVEEPDRCSPWGHKELDMTECLSTMQGAQLMSVTT